MASLPIALNSYVSPADALRLLGQEPVSDALPLQAICPICNEPRLMLFEDTITGGAWHYCFNTKCGQVGDLIELLGAAWDMSPLATVDKLVRDGFPFPEEEVTPERIDFYVSSRIHARQRVRKFWESCQQYLAGKQSSKMGALRDKFCLGSEPYTPTGTGRFLGANSRSAIGEILDRAVRSSIQHNPVFYRSCAGPWLEALVLPFHDLPKRICGFWLAARKGDRIDDVSYQSSHFNNTIAHGPLEAGLYGVDTVWQSDLPYDKRVIAVHCPALAVRLQQRWLRDAGNPMPLVAWYERGRYQTRQAWHMLNGYEMVFWCLDMTPQLMHQAIITDGAVSRLHMFQPTGKNAFDKYICGGSLLDLGRKIIRWSKPWRTVLSEWAEKSTYGQVEQMLLGLERYGHHRPDVCQHDSKLLKGYCHERKFARRCWHVKLGYVTEYDDQWWAGPLERRHSLMNAIVRIEGTKMIKDVPHYLGALIFRGQRIRFEIPVDTFQQRRDPKLVRVLTSIALKRGNGVLHVAPNFSCRILDVALSFSNPHGL